MKLSYLGLAALVLAGFAGVGVNRVTTTAPVPSDQKPVIGTGSEIWPTCPPWCGRPAPKK